MPIVIPFAPRVKPVQATPAAMSEPAQILFFTGVRYERQPEALPAEMQPRRRRRPARAAVRATIAGHQV